MMMRTKTGKLYLGFSLVLGLLMILSAELSAQGPTPALQTTPTRVRPTVGPLGDGGPTTASIAGDAVTSDNCASVYGAAVHWGVGGRGNIGLLLSGGGWQVQSVTSDDGQYNFGALGVGTGILRVNTGSPDLHPMVNNVAVRLTCNFVTQANIGLYGGNNRPTPPGHLTMRSSAPTLLPGENTDIVLTIENSLPDPISQVIVTDLFPEGLKIESVETAVGTVEALDGQMLTVMVGSLPAGGEVEITVSARVEPELPQGAHLLNTATLFYAEGVSDQASLVIEVGAPGAIAGVENEPVATDVAGRETEAQTQTQSEAATQSDADMNQNNDSGQAPNVLPVTGVGVALSLPLALVVLVGLCLKGFSSIKNRPD